MGKTDSRATPADALVIFGVTGDLAHKMIFSALYTMVKRGELNVPVVGVASSKWSLTQLRKQAKDSIKQAGKVSIIFSLCSSMWVAIITSQVRSAHSSRPWAMSRNMNTIRPGTQPKRKPSMTCSNTWWSPSSIHATNRVSAAPGWRGWRESMALLTPRFSTNRGV